MYRKWTPADISYSMNPTSAVFCSLTATLRFVERFFAKAYAPQSKQLVDWEANFIAGCKQSNHLQ